MSVPRPRPLCFVRSRRRIQPTLSTSPRLPPRCGRRRVRPPSSSGLMIYECSYMRWLRVRADVGPRPVEPDRWGQYPIGLARQGQSTSQHQLLYVKTERMRPTASSAWPAELPNEKQKRSRDGGYYWLLSILIRLRAPPHGAVTDQVKGGRRFRSGYCLRPHTLCASAHELRYPLSYLGLGTLCCPGRFLKVRPGLVWSGLVHDDSDVSKRRLTRPDPDSNPGVRGCGCWRAPSRSEL